MRNFYEATGGITLLVIKHHGTSFDYINGAKRQPYYDKWSTLLPFMEEGKVYVVACRVRLTTKAASLYPFGIAFEVTESEGRALSLEHVAQVESGVWDAVEEYPRLHADCQLFEARVRDRLYTSSLNRRANKEKTYV